MLFFSGIRFGAAAVAVTQPPEAYNGLAEVGPRGGLIGSAPVADAQRQGNAGPPGPEETVGD